ncbi:serine hydrolase domain-containing protein [Pedobacter sp. JY14-1]|uniref:serine hydrolase domain-containing protein n=1 Tax=Pedobacter sp. JY14-1 TaxID=3034151 RepID=UPI0023E2812D|nr:serine hydrolase domain-containing protein [Pedobacter sp. JY14-1]
MYRNSHMALRIMALILPALCLLKPASVSGQTLSVLPDSLAGKVDAIFDQWNKPSSPGCVIGIVRNDSVIYAKGYGLSNIEYDITNTPGTIYHMASVSKQFTAYAIVLLARQGKIGLDEDIRKYLPWFPDLKSSITVRQLLNHTSGIRDQWQLLAISGTRIDDVIKQEHIVKILQKQRALNFRPGEQYSYSNSGYTMLAEIIRSVTGQSLRQFTDSAIFRPLGMKNTHFHDDYTEVVKNRSYSYYSGSKGFSNSILSYSNAGATSLFTNVSDMAKWIANFYMHRVGEAEDIQTLTEKGKLNNGKTIDYALGIVVNNFKGWKQYTHNGADAGYRTAVASFPELKMGFILFSNLGDFNMGKFYEMAGLFIKEKTISRVPVNKRVVPDTSNAVLKDIPAIKRFLGDYLADDGAQYHFRITGQKLYGERQGRTELLLKLKKDTFQTASEPDLKFIFSVTRTGDTIVRECWPGGQIFKKYTLDFHPTDKQLQAYAGTYYSPELDCKYGIALKGHELVLTNVKYDDTPIKFTGEDHLRTAFWWMAHLKVLRNNTNQITGFEVNDGRVMHLLFNKID